MISTHIIVIMKRHIIAASSTRASNWLATSLCLVLAFSLYNEQSEQFVNALQQQQQQQQASSNEHNAVAAAAAAAAAAAQDGHSIMAPSGQMMSMGSESSSALETSAALAGDDLIAAESSQSPADGAAEHKSFTASLPSAIRQVSFTFLEHTFKLFQNNNE